ncbi:hypothetical protein PQF38_004124 [Klebsiella pneumoniae]|nr:hypothetical protein [Klebsiella pneumoniae]MDP0620187.1 hypothetical protein [Klebsiella pneumoniae]
MPGGAGIFPEEAHCALGATKSHSAVAPVSDSATGDVEAIQDR